ncbi:hypothetical protein [Lyngbya confervoides]|uniref:Gas vesicle protein n=1 Tax=Lyngbya confervoides BDU141951 TaxID=1574623 RepID=A0ABD4T710_9CYAN|nr:hypothetical protein [Lyngbya confervoides]MCM1984238.1 hypothetical protein [Lyngbya confervoides BDU141951]
MANQGDRFLGGFIAGSIFGGIVGGLVGSYLATRLEDQSDAEEDAPEGSIEGTLRGARRLLRRSSDLSIEDARQGLEEKIAELNDAIDAAREQLSHVNGISEDHQ